MHGAAGGVGLAAVELGKVYGATVIAVASTEEKLAIARQRGADHTLLAGQPFRDKVKELTGGKGADVVFDPVGGAVFEESVRCINWGARLIIVGFLAGIGVARTNLVLIKNATVHGIRAGEVRAARPVARPAATARPDGIRRSRKNLAEHFAPPAARAHGGSDAASDRPQGDRPRRGGDGLSNTQRRHAPRKRAIQYAVKLRLEPGRWWLLDHPLSRMMTTEGRDCWCYSYVRSFHHGKYDGMSFDTVLVNFGGRFSRNDTTPSFTSAEAPRE